jgi:hypothetical protein
VWAVRKPDRVKKVALPANAPLAALTRQAPGATSPARDEPAKPAVTISRDKLSRARSAPPRPEPPAGPAGEEGAESLAPREPESAALPSAKRVAGDLASLPETPAGSGGGIAEQTGGPSAKATRKTENPVEKPSAGAQTDERLPTSSQIVLEDPNTKQMETLAPNQPNSAVAGTSLRTPSRYRAIDASAATQALEQRTNVIVISTPNPSVKWRITKPSFIERTEDGGATWFGEEVDANGSLLAASAPDAKTCWVVGRQGAVYVTKDAQTWKKTAAPTDADLVAVAGRNGSSAIVTSADGRRFSTRDGGKKWKPLSSSADSNQH